MIEDSYFLGNCISSFSPNVFFATHVRTGEGLIAKREDKTNSRSPFSLEREYLLLKNIPWHANIIESVDFICSDPVFNYLFVKDAGAFTLSTYILKFGSIEESQALKIFTSLCSAIKHIHSLKIVHGDIKPENIVLSPSLSPILCDFGGAIQYTNGIKIKARLVSIPFSAPEVKEEQKSSVVKPKFGRNLSKLSMNSQPSETIFSEDSEWERGKSRDIWGLGMILFCMLTGKAPWSSEEWQKGLFEFPSLMSPLNKNPINESIVSLMRGLLQENINHRFRLEQFFQNDILRWSIKQEPTLLVLRSESTPVNSKKLSWSFRNRSNSQTSLFPKRDKRGPSLMSLSSYKSK